MLGRALVLSIAVAASACSFVVKSKDLLGEDGTAVGDGGVGSLDSGSGPGSDAGADGPPTTTDGGTCQGKMLCDDFEGSSAIMWRTDRSGNAAVVVDGVNARGGSKSLHATRAAAADRGAAFFNTALESRLRSCELDAFVTATGGTNVSFFAAGFGMAEPPFARYEVSLQMGPPGSGGVSQFGPQTSGPALYTSVHAPDLGGQGNWTHVRIEFDWNAPSVSVSGNGKPAVTLPLSSVKGSSPYLLLGGIYQAESGDGWESFIDNVVCVTE